MLAFGSWDMFCGASTLRRPVVLGLVLGRVLENSLRQSLVILDGISGASGRARFGHAHGSGHSGPVILRWSGSSSSPTDKAPGYA